MTPEKQRIAIAEACGWKPDMGLGSMYACWEKDGYIWPLPTLPDFLNDLNAMHEAEKALPDDIWLKFAHDFLSPACLKDLPKHAKIFRRESATAAQRAEAFLRAIGKWE